MHALFKRLRSDLAGATAVEYGMLIGLLSVVIVVGLQSFTDQLTNTWMIVQTYSENALAKD